MNIIIHHRRGTGPGRQRDSRQKTTKNTLHKHAILHSVLVVVTSPQTAIGPWAIWLTKNYAFDTMPLLTAKNTWNTKNGQAKLKRWFVASMRPPQTDRLNSGAQLRRRRHIFHAKSRKKHSIPCTHGCLKIILILILPLS